MNPFADMPTHVMNDINTALWIAFFVSWVIFTPALVIVKHAAGESRRRARPRRTVT